MGRVGYWHGEWVGAMSKSSLSYHDYIGKPEPIDVDSKCLGGGRWFIHIGDLTLFLTEGRAREIRDAITAKLPAVEPEQGHPDDGPTEDQITASLELDAELDAADANGLAR